MWNMNKFNLLYINVKTINYYFEGMHPNIITLLECECCAGDEFMFSYLFKYVVHENSKTLA